RGEDLAVRGETRGHKLRGIWPHTGSLRRPPSIRRRVDEREYIATYPEFVTMLGMVADPAWRARRAPRRWVNLSQHRRTIDAAYTEAEHRLNVPSLRKNRHTHTFSNDALFRWTDSLGRSLMLVMSPEDHNALRDDSQWN
ncbi:hypothetical protein, partial [Streptomyces sp. NPDC088554]|uniref:hypothetical protein n=1 Tax=Streptomyces sp. NPDC088554 TaxID=3365865 RepID=UPI003814EB17